MAVSASRKRSKGAKGRSAAPPLDPPEAGGVEDSTLDTAGVKEPLAARSKGKGISSSSSPRHARRKSAPQRRKKTGKAAAAEEVPMDAFGSSSSEGIPTETKDGVRSSPVVVDNLLDALSEPSVESIASPSASETSTATPKQRKERKTPPIRSRQTSDRPSPRVKTSGRESREGTRTRTTKALRGSKVASPSLSSDKKSHQEEEPSVHSGSAAVPESLVEESISSPPEGKELPTSSSSSTPSTAASSSAAKSRRGSRSRGGGRRAAGKQSAELAAPRAQTTTAVSKPSSSRSRSVSGRRRAAAPKKIPQSKDTTASVSASPSPLPLNRVAPALRERQEQNTHAIALRAPRPTAMLPGSGYAPPPPPPPSSSPAVRRAAPLTGPPPLAPLPERALWRAIAGYKAAFSLSSIRFNAATGRVESNPQYRRRVALKLVALQGVATQYLRTVFPSGTVESAHLEHFTPREGLLVFVRCLLILLASADASFPLVTALHRSATQEDHDPLVCLRDIEAAHARMPELEGCFARRNAAPVVIAATGHLLAGGGLAQRAIETFMGRLQHRLQAERIPALDVSRTPAERQELQITADSLDDLHAAVKTLQLGYLLVQPSAAPLRPDGEALYVLPSASDADREDGGGPESATRVLVRGFYQLLRTLLGLTTLEGLWPGGLTVGGQRRLGASDKQLHVPGEAFVPLVRLTQFQPATGRLTLERYDATSPWGLMVNEKGELLNIHLHARHATPAGAKLFQMLQYTNDGAGLPIVEVEHRKLFLPANPETKTRSQREEESAFPLRERQARLREALASVEKKRVVHLQLDVRPRSTVPTEGEESESESESGRHRKTRGEPLPSEICCMQLSLGEESSLGQRVLLVLQRHTTTVSWGLALKLPTATTPSSNASPSAVTDDFTRLFDFTESSLQLSPATRTFLRRRCGQLALRAINFHPIPSRSGLPYSASLSALSSSSSSSTATPAAVHAVLSPLPHRKAMMEMLSSSLVLALEMEVVAPLPRPAAEEGERQQKSEALQTSAAPSAGASQWWIIPEAEQFSDPASTAAAATSAVAETEAVSGVATMPYTRAPSASRPSGAVSLPLPTTMEPHPSGSPASPPHPLSPLSSRELDLASPGPTSTSELFLPFLPEPSAKIVSDMEAVVRAVVSDTSLHTGRAAEAEAAAPTERRKRSSTRRTSEGRIPAPEAKVVAPTAKASQKSRVAPEPLWNTPLETLGDAALRAVTEQRSNVPQQKAKRAEKSSGKTDITAKTPEAEQKAPKRSPRAKERPTTTATREPSPADLRDAPPLSFGNEVTLKKFDGVTAEFERSSETAPWDLTVLFTGDEVRLTKLPPFSSKLTPKEMEAHPFVRALGVECSRGAWKKLQKTGADVSWKLDQVNNQDLSLLTRKEVTKVLQTNMKQKVVRLVMRSLPK